jgi:DNA-binding MarR family transcriptional regulator
MPSASATPSAPLGLGPLAECLCYMLRRINNAVDKQAIGIFAPLRLRPLQYAVLLFLDHAPGHNQSDVAAALGIQRANFVGLVRGLVRRKLVRRSPGANDKRERVLHLTKAGEDLLRRAKRADARLDARLDKKLGPRGRKSLLALLQKLV